jgi:hypothetical protein
MWYRWTKVNRADIPADLRASFESYGEIVVAQIMGRPYTHAVGTIGVPPWAGDVVQRQHALAWLREQHNETERQHDANMTMEVAITVFVAIEVVPTVWDWIRELVNWFASWR